MSSASWPELALAADLGLELELLCQALDISMSGAFIFAIREEGELRRRLMQHVRDHLQEDGRDLLELDLSPEQPDLAGALLSWSWERGAGGEGRPPVVFVHARKLADAGLRVDGLPADHPDRVHVEQVRRALRALNFQRERLGRLNVPLLFWLSQNKLGQVMQHAADILAARGGLFLFETTRRAPGAPPPVRAEVAAEMLGRFHRTLLPPEELRKRAALYERRLARERGAEEPNWPRIAFLCDDLSNIHRELDDYERAIEFLRQAIEAYRRAIAEWSKGAEEQEWALLQHRLGYAYGELAQVRDRVENLARAIQCYQEALRFYTPEAAPLDYAMTQNNLGLAYGDLPTGDRAENLERAIKYLSNALAIWTAESFPHYHEIAARNLERALAAAAPPPVS